MIIEMSEIAPIGEKPIISEGLFEGPGGLLYRRSIRPENGAVARIALVHGYGDHSGRHVHFMRWMAERRVACDAFDLRGQGLAEGRRGYVRRWEEYLDDLSSFLSLVRSDYPADLPLFLMGHSHGGLIVAAAGESVMLETAGVRGVVLTSPYLRSRMIVPLRKIALGRAVVLFVPWMRIATGLTNEGMTSDPAMIAESSLDPLITRSATPRWYLAHLRVQRRVMAEAVQFRLPLLILAAGADVVADSDASEEFVRSAISVDKRFQLIPSQKHELLRETGRPEVFMEIFDWILAHL